MVSTDDMLFLVKCRDAIRTMKAAGMRDYWIATCITEIRSAAIYQEHTKLTECISNNYTPFMHPSEMEKQIKEVIDYD